MAVFWVVALCSLVDDFRRYTQHYSRKDLNYAHLHGN
jgi:hypothetical protein